jgi:hypothetical protein
MVSGEDKVVYDTGYLHAWGCRVKGSQTLEFYDSSRGSTVTFPTQLINTRYGDVDLFQFASTLAVNPYKWGFIDGRTVTTEVVRVTFRLVDGTPVSIGDPTSADDMIAIELPYSAGKDDDMPPFPGISDPPEFSDSPATVQVHAPDDDRRKVITRDLLLIATVL